MITYRKLSPIKAITFDLDDTLYDNMPYIHEAERSLQTYIAANYPAAAHISQTQWRHFRTRALRNKPSLRNDIGGLRKAMLGAGFENAGIQDLSHAVDDCFNYFYKKRSDFTLDKHTHNILDQLSQRIPLAAITNGNVDCKAIGIAQYFSHIIQASPEFPMKPDRAMFLEMTTLLNMPAAQILHVGDDLEKDIKGAHLAGYQSAWFAIDRKMTLTNEPVEVLPHIQINCLSQLQQIII